MSEAWVRYEDEHLLVVVKPAGVPVRRAHRHGQEGLLEWVRSQRAGHRLDLLHHPERATSGAMVLGKSDLARRSFGDRRGPGGPVVTREVVVRRDDRRDEHVRSRAPVLAAAEAAGARSRPPVEPPLTFDLLRSGADHQLHRVQARGVDGAQVRDLAAAVGMAVVGDRSHAGDDATRLFMHEVAIRFEHPDGGIMELAEPVPASFDELLDSGVSDRLAAAVADEARRPFFDPAETDSYLWIDRHHDGFPDVRVERLGAVAFVSDQREQGGPLPEAWVDAWMSIPGVRAVYRQRRDRDSTARGASLVAGRAEPRFEVREHGARYVVDLEASPTSTGLFLDQRETRRRLLATDRRGSTVLNVFAHTGSLSVAAALAGAETLTQDLSTTYLDWARENLRANGVDPAEHDFVYGDALDWMRRFSRKGRRFDVVLVDPPSTSTTRKGKRWSVARDLHGLVELGASLTVDDGSLFVSTNMAKLPWAKFLHHIERGLSDAGRRARVEIQTLPLDHRSDRDDPPYLKAAWLDFSTPAAGPAGRARPSSAGRQHR